MRIFKENIFKAGGQINSLTGIRAVAAGVVVLHHLVPSLEYTFRRSVLEELNVGVTIFFVLSGFLITYRYYGKSQNGKQWFFTYGLNRVARIFPMYFMLTTFTFSMIILADHLISAKTVYTYILNVTLPRGFFGQFVYSGIAQGWTLTVEECFYFSAPFMFVISQKVHLVVQAAAIFLTGFIFFLIFRNIDFYGFMNDLPTIYLTTFFGRVFEFVIGILAALHLMNRKVISYSTILGGASFVLLFLLQIGINYYSKAYAIQTIGGFLVNEFLLPLSIGLLIQGLIMEKTYLKSFLQTKVMVVLGKSSYTLYLLHWGFTSYLINRFWTSNVFLTILITYILSILLWFFIEEPCNRLVRSWAPTKDVRL